MLIELRDVHKVFNQGKPNEFTAVQGVSLWIEACRATVIKGPSGSGKTTLLSLIGCMARPTSGRIEILGREVSSLPERFLTGVRRETFGFIFQHFNLIKGITALENVMLPAYPSGEKQALAQEEGARPPRPLRGGGQGAVEGRKALGGRGPAGDHRPGPDQRPVRHHRRRADGPPRHTAGPRSSWRPWPG